MNTIFVLASQQAIQPSRQAGRQASRQAGTFKNDTFCLHATSFTPNCIIYAEAVAHFTHIWVYTYIVTVMKTFGPTRHKRHSSYFCLLHILYRDISVPCASFNWRQHLFVVRRRHSWLLASYWRNSVPFKRRSPPIVAQWQWLSPELQCPIRAHTIALKEMLY